jgi:hypothetical protein
MATVDEAVDKYMAAIKSMDIGTLMATLTPEALSKAMAQMGSGPPPGSVDSISAEKQGEENGEYVYHLNVTGSAGSAVMMTRWKEIDGAWKVTDVGQVEG